MPATLAPPTTTRRPALGDRTNSHANVSLNNKGNKNLAILPVKPNKLVLQVVDDAAPNPVTTNTNKEATTTSTNKINTVVVQEDEATHQPTKIKRVDVFSDSTWDDITAIDNKTNDDRRASIVSVSILHILNGIPLDSRFHFINYYLVFLSLIILDWIHVSFSFSFW
jgi:hypothetical protein